MKKDIEVIFSYIKKLCKEKAKVFLVTKGNFCYTGFIQGTTEKNILLLDKTNEEVFIFLDDIKRIDRFREKKRGDLDGRKL